MHIKLRDIISLASSSLNEDRAGQAGALAWVIDGATDVLENRILPGHSDSAWFAGELDKCFYRASEQPDALLHEIAAQATNEIQSRFEATALRPVKYGHEHPSAAAILMHVEGNKLSYFSLGDCSLLCLPGRESTWDVVFGKDRRTADEENRDAAAKLTEEKHSSSHPHGIRDELMPMLRASRDALNKDEGYGIFSITHAPEHFIKSGEIEIESGDQFLLASDGLMRLVDVFEVYTLEAFGEKVLSHGIPVLMQELRSIENGDAECFNFPRAKARDDATGLIVEVVE